MNINRFFDEITCLTPAKSRQWDDLLLVEIFYKRCDYKEDRRPAAAIVTVEVLGQWQATKTTAEPDFVCTAAIVLMIR